MEFVRKYAMLIMRSEKNNRRNRKIKSRNNQNAWKKENYKYLEILETDTTKQAEIKEK